MGTFKARQLDAVHLQNVSFTADEFDPVLNHVDIELPLDQNILIKSSNPNHGIDFLQILAGLKKPQSGCVKWNEKDIFSDEVADILPRHLMGCYFDHLRPIPHHTVSNIFISAGLHQERIDELLEQFNFSHLANKKFKDLNYENQKAVQLMAIISKEPQMLLLEDPASGLSEFLFLEILDLIQYGQRRGNLRHIFFTNNHPTALRHLDAAVMHLEDGFLYMEEKLDTKKIFNF